MSSRFVRASKFRHVYGTGTRREQCYDNVRVSRNAWDSNLIKVNCKFLSVNLEASGGGAFMVIPLANTGKFTNEYPVVNGHTAAVLDTDFNPFNDCATMTRRCVDIVASCGEDCKVNVWSIPENGLTENLATPTLQFNTHIRKVGHVLFHPSAENILLSSGADLIIKLYDIQQGQEKQDVIGHVDIVNSIAWNWNGSMIATASKDKKIRLIDVRANKVVQETNGHQGVKGSRVVWCGDSDRIFTTGFSKSSDRQFMLWDVKNMAEPLKSENLDTSSGGLIPFYDQDTKMIYVGGKGDGNIRYLEYIDEAPFVYPLSEYKSADPQRGLAFLPKRALAVAECEIGRAYKVHPDRIEPISFRVPRKSDQFQADIYPETLGDQAALTASDWLAGKNANPLVISLEKGFLASAKREFVTEAVALSTSETRDPVKNPQSDKEYQDAFHCLRKDNDALKNENAQKDVRVRQLELQLENLMGKQETEKHAKN